MAESREAADLSHNSANLGNLTQKKKDHSMERSPSKSSQRDYVDRSRSCSPGYEEYLRAKRRRSHRDSDSDSEDHRSSRSSSRSHKHDYDRYNLVIFVVSSLVYVTNIVFFQK